MAIPAPILGMTRVYVCLAFDRRGRQFVDDMALDSVRVNSISRLAGSYHVLEMGRHFDDYTGGAALPQLVPQKYFQNLQSSQVYAPLDRKLRAAGVTANIGEALGALVARKIMNRKLREVAHLTTKGKYRNRKAPDYLIQLGKTLPAALQIDAELTAINAGPGWWPAESKARNRPSRRSLKDALAQIIAYWWSLLNGPAEKEIGYGVIFHYLYAGTFPQIDIHILAPANQARLLAYLKARDKAETYSKFIARMKKSPGPILRLLING